MPYLTYEISVLDMERTRPQAATAVGGRVIVCRAGTARKLSLFNPDVGPFNALSQATGLGFTRGRLRFSVDDSFDQVDIYGFAPTGHFISMRGVRPGAEAEIPVDTLRLIQMATIPFAAVDYAANVEVDTGLDMPAGSVVLPGCHLRVTTAEASRTVSFGMLSSESGGAANGFLAGASLATAGTVAPTLASTPTLGSLLRTLAGTTPDIAVPRPYPITTAVSLSITTAASTASAEGFVCFPYSLQPL